MNARPLVIGLAVAWATSSVAGAAGPVADGWWTTSPVPLAPDPEAGLVVQGGPQPDQPLAYAAVAFPLDEGEAASQLTLSVPADAVATPGASLTVCPLLEPFEPAHGAPADAAPAYDCTTSVTAVPEGATYVVDVAGLEGAGELAVALLPSTPVDRIVLARPGDDALTTDVSSSEASSPLPSSSAPSPAASTSSGSSSVPRRGASTPPVRTPAPPAVPVTPTPTTAAPAAQPQAAPAPSTQPASSSGGDSGPNGRLVLVLALAAIAVALWSASGALDEPDVVAEPAA